MSIISQVLLVLSAALFFFIFYLETIATASDRTSKVFSISKEELEAKSMNVLMKNQGVYNGFIGLALLYAAFFSPNGREVAIVFLVNILVVAAYGGATSSPSILMKQGTLPFLALLSLLFF
ncbi:MULTISPECIES: DUF1304 family protein [unclassified Streptococcus]|uniref:DUF1304 domain-containing protein n=1 Tax=unclassified Streptococcus TaxID=2608887 RepID=UPI0018AB1F66|nr:MULTISPECIES: DUF1304 family protein [unclassified Streptococcus]MBF8970649.1 DUF1304 family protein [Streptococcus sp. NLN76]MBG9367001.1 DUF1304 family protein [Streptococcus sp. NLN64]